MLALAILHAQPTRHVDTIDGRTLGVASASLTCGQATVFLVPPDLVEAFETARADVAGRQDYPLVLSYREDGHLTLHAVDTDIVRIDAGRSAFATPVDVRETAVATELERAALRLAA